MISRVADHCFWFGRYLERAESTARVLAVTSHLALDGELTPEQCWLPVVIVSGEREHFLARNPGAEAQSQSQSQSQSQGSSSQTQTQGGFDWNEAVPRYMSWDEDNLTSLVQSIGAVRENARSIREVLSLEAWETTNELYLWMADPDGGPAEYERDRYAFYRHIRRSIQLCLGLVRSTMLHDAPLDFMWLGVMLERVGQTARVLDVHHHAFTNLPSRQEVVETALWLSLLRACSGFEPFMKRNQGKVTADAVARFLIFEPDFPRSLRFCLDAAHTRFFEHIRPPAQASLPGADTAARLGALAAWLRDRAREPMPADVHELLTYVVDETAGVCAGLSREMFGA